MTKAKRPLKVFLSHAHADRDAVRALYSRLTKDGVDAWLDKEKLLPGQDWELEIRKAVREADVVVVCLSKQFNQAGFRQKEVRLALDTAMEKPEGEIFIIPARLDDCAPLESLRKWHWVDLFEENGYEILMRALRLRADKIGAILQAKTSSFPEVTTPQARVAALETKPPRRQEEREDVLISQVEKSESTLPKALRKVKTLTILAPVGASVIILTVLISQLWLKSPLGPNISTRTSLSNEGSSASTSCGTAPGNWDVYVVQAGDTLFSIAISRNVSLQELAAINCLSDSTRILVGQQLLVPTVDVTEVSPAASNAIPALLPEFTDPKGVEMVLVPAGDFMMGREDGNADEKPVQDVYLDAFYIDKYEVTNILYKACSDAGVCSPPKDTRSFTRTQYYGNPEFKDYPVVYVDWSMAQVYCEWRSGSLPSEAQWEKAARGFDGLLYPWGEGIGCDYANYEGCVGDTSEVGTYDDGASPYGAYDMAGNVWEWTMDWYNAYPEAAPGASEEYGQVFRVLRGGSYHSPILNVQSANRWRIAPNDFNDNFGFRCIRLP